MVGRRGMVRCSVRKALATIVTPICAFGCAADAGPPGYQAALREAKLNFGSAEGSRYRRQIEKLVRATFSDSIGPCYVQIPDTRGANLLYRLDASGETAELIVYPPDSEFAGCVLDGAPELELPPPPKPGYWISIRLVAHPEL